MWCFQVGADLILTDEQTFILAVILICASIGLFTWSKTSATLKQRLSPPTYPRNPAYGRHAYLQLEDIKLHYVENGNRNKPMMLFLHGFPEFWFSWRHQLEKFSRSHWVVALDLRGYGESEKPRQKSDYDVEILVKDVVKFLCGLNRKNCILVGHDWGGVLAWFVAARYPGLVEKLIVLNAPHPSTYIPHVRSSLRQFLKSWYIFFLQLPYIPELIFSLNTSWVFTRIFLDENGRLAVTEEDLEIFKQAFSTPSAWTGPIHYYRQNVHPKVFLQAVEDLPIITSPTLFIWGERDFALTKPFPELAREYVQLLSIKFIPNGNHFVQQDKVDIVNDLMTEFIFLT